MSVARHPRPKELEGVPLDEIMKKYVGRFKDKKPDWAAFEDAKIEGYKRAQHRFIGAGGSGKHGDPTVIPPGNFTLSIVYVEPGQGNAAHTHEVEECFFVLQGFLDVFVEDESGGRVTTRLGPWECISCPAGVIHGYQNDSLEPVYFQVMLGRGKPDTMGYADDELYKRKDALENRVRRGCRKESAVSRHKKLLDRDRRDDEALFGHVPDERLERRTVRFDAVGPAIAAKQRVDLFNIGR